MLFLLFVLFLIVIIPVGFCRIIAKCFVTFSYKRVLVSVEMEEYESQIPEILRLFYSSFETELI